MVIRNAGDAQRTEDHFENVSQREAEESGQISTRTQACGTMCKWKYWVKGIDFATVQFSPETTSMCSPDAPFPKSLIFHADRCTKVIKIWKTSHKSMSQWTTVWLGWAGEPLSFLILELVFSPAPLWTPARPRSFVASPEDSYYFFQVLHLSFLPLSTGVINKDFPTHTDVIIWLLILGKGMDVIFNLIS